MAMTPCPFCTDGKQPTGFSDESNDLLEWSDCGECDGTGEIDSPTDDLLIEEDDDE